MNWFDYWRGCSILNPKWNLNLQNPDDEPLNPRIRTIKQKSDLSGEMNGQRQKYHPKIGWDQVLLKNKTNKKENHIQFNSPTKS